MPKSEQLKSDSLRGLRGVFSRQSLAIWSGAFLLSVLAGPFGTFRDLDLGARALFWGMVVTASVLVGHLSRGLAARVAGVNHPVLFDAVAIGTMTVFLTPLIWGIGRFFEPVVMVWMSSFLNIFLCILLVSLIIFGLRRVIAGMEPHTSRFGNSESGSLPDSVDTPKPRLLRRLEAAVQGEILRISAMDHHVEIATRQGAQVLRMRLGDAIGEMEPIEGYCAHRSHWVTRAAIARVEREGGQKTWLILHNGDRIPVSRKYRPDLEAAGIL